ncbi:MAG: FecR domain-containing protein [Candidatus Omnitrophota bacterium]
MQGFLRAVVLLMIINLLIAPKARDYLSAQSSQEVVSSLPSRGEQGIPGQIGTGSGSQEQDISQDSIAESSPLIEIKRISPDSDLFSIELRDETLRNIFQYIAHNYNLNILVDNEVSGNIKASFTNISLEEAMDSIAEISNLILEKKKNIIVVKPNLITRIFVLKYTEAKKIAQISSSVSSQAAETTGATAKSSESSAVSGASEGATALASSKQESTIYDLLSDKGKVLLGKQPNSLMVIDYPPNIARIENYLSSIDQKMARRIFKLKYLKAGQISGGDSGSLSTDSTGGAASATSTTSSGS